MAFVDRKLFVNFDESTLGIINLLPKSQRMFCCVDLLEIPCLPSHCPGNFEEVQAPAVRERRPVAKFSFVAAARGHGVVAGLSRCVRVFMFVVAWRSVKPIVAGGLILHSLRLPGEELHELGEDLGAVSAREAEGELGDEQAVRGAEVVPVAVDLEGQIPFAVGELRQCR